MKTATKVLIISIAIMLVACCSCHKAIPQIKYYPNGRIEESGFIRDGKPSGDFKYYYSNGNLAGEGKYRRGIPVGVWNYYFENGEIMTIQEYNRKGNTINLNCWDQRGNHAVVNGTGTITKYYPDGTIESIISYKDCYFDGLNGNWYPNGNKMEEITYKDGKPIGTWSYWDEDGKLLWKKEF